MSHGGDAAAAADGPACCCLVAVTDTDTAGPAGRFRARAFTRTGGAALPLLPAPSCSRLGGEDPVPPPDVDSLPFLPPRPVCPGR